MKTSSENVVIEALETSVKSGEIASQIQTLVETLQKNKKDIQALKVMLYTGIALLVGGFFFYTNAIQSVRLQAQDANVYSRQSKGDLKTMTIQQGVLQEVQSLKTDVDHLIRQNVLGNGNHVEQAVVGMNNTLALLNDEPSKIRGLSLQVQRTSQEFIEAYKTHNTSTSNR